MGDHDPKAPVATGPPPGKTAALEVLARDEDVRPVDDHVLRMHVPVRRVDVPRPGHGVDRDPALPEPGDDPLLLARDPADRPALQQDGYVHATPRGIDERLGEHGARELVGRDEDLPAGAAGEGEEDLLGTVRGDEGDAVHTTERRLPELRLA